MMPDGTAGRSTFANQDNREMQQWSADVFQNCRTTFTQPRSEGMQRRMKGFFKAVLQVIVYVTTVYIFLVLYNLAPKWDTGNNPKIVLYWNTFFGMRDFRMGLGEDPFKKCGTRNCYVTDDRSFANVANSILIHAASINDSDLPFRMSSEQIFVLFLLEPPKPELNFTSYKGLFNWTMTYREDSDIWVPYGQLYPLDGRNVTIRGKQQWRNRSEDGTTIAMPETKTKLIAWFVSNCRTDSRREEYVDELSKYVQVDKFGVCGSHFCGHRGSTYCDEVLEQDYKFYLSFENSICTDYITEKFFNPLRLWIVPIVLGGGDYSKVAPPHSYIDVRGFESPKQLAEYLLYLDRNDSEYRSYFWWKRFYKVENDWSVASLPLCQLCSMLHKNLPHSSYDNIQEWWTEGMCV